jgi:hypothetical protein
VKGPKGPRNRPPPPKRRALLRPMGGDNICINCSRRWTPTPEMWKKQRLVCVHCGAVHEPLFGRSS